MYAIVALIWIIGVSVIFIMSPAESCQKFPLEYLIDTNAKL